MGIGLSALGSGTDSELAHVYAMQSVLPLTSYMPPSHSVGLGLNPYTRAVVGRGQHTTAAPTFAVMVL